MRKITPPQQLHIPVLLEDTIRLLAPKAGETYLDLTAGYGGHATKVVEVVGAGNVTLVDRDAHAIAELQHFAASGATLVHSDFLGSARQFVETGESFDMILIDLGVSSPQLDRAERGFSIKRDGPLDMRMDNRSERTASELLNRSSKRDLMSILEDFGEERPRNAERIAMAIIKARPLSTTSDLANAVMSIHRGKYQSVHPATRTFQAVRIALNDELTQVRELMPLLPKLLNKGGRVVVISFHSLEDRIVKQYLAEQADSGFESELGILAKAIKGDIHDVHNPRARSAILRSAVKK